MDHLTLFENFKDKVTVYHGTTDILFSRILSVDKKIKPRSDNKYVYVTTDKKVAERYAKAWTAWAIKEACPALEIEPNYKGLIFQIELDKKDLAKDPYSEKEPNQYRYTGAIPIKNIVDYERPDFNELKNETALLTNFAFWIGVARATDDDEDIDNPFNALGGDVNKLNKQLDDEGL